MIRTQALIALFLSALVSGTVACKSQERPAAAPQAAAIVVEVKPEATDETRPPTDLASAIATAKATARGSRFVGAGFNDGEGKGVYHVVLLEKSLVHIISVDAQDGKLLESQDEELEEETRTEIEEMLKLEAGVDIGKAIEAAMAEVPRSWARAAGMGEHENETCYAVLVVQGEALKDVLVSMKDGKVLQVSDAEEEEEGEEGMEESQEMEGEEKAETPAPAPK